MRTVISLDTKSQNNCLYLTQLHLFPIVFCSLWKKFTFSRLSMFSLQAHTEACYLWHTMPACLMPTSPIKNLSCPICTLYCKRVMERSPVSYKRSHTRRPYHWSGSLTSCAVKCQSAHYKNAIQRPPSTEHSAIEHLTLLPVLIHIVFFERNCLYLWYYPNALVQFLVLGPKSL